MYKDIQGQKVDPDSSLQTFMPGKRKGNAYISKYSQPSYGHEQMHAETVELFKVKVLTIIMQSINAEYFLEMSLSINFK